MWCALDHALAHSLVSPRAVDRIASGRIPCRGRVLMLRTKPLRVLAFGVAPLRGHGRGRPEEFTQRPSAVFANTHDIDRGSHRAASRP
jgi:hypothetical protein